MAVPDQIQIIDVFDGDGSCDYMCGVGMHRLSPGPWWCDSWKVGICILATC